MPKFLTIAVAPDSFKGVMTATEAASRIERGLKRAMESVRVRKIPMADGGEGTVSAIVNATGGRLVRRVVRDPLGRNVRSTFGLSGDGSRAIIEMSSASGLALLKSSERNPLKTSTCGTGDLMRAALDLKVKRLLIGIGGSATNDGGMGMARALGFKFLDRLGRELREGGGALIELDRIDPTGVDSRLARVGVEVACDVDNPLTGSRGAAHVYGPQKGASPATVQRLDEGLRRLAKIVRRDVGIDVSRVPGAGAAGGLGAGLMAFAGAMLRPGVDIVIDAVDLRRQLFGCSFVITGEGKMDGQTLHGKTPAGVAGVAKSMDIPVVAICGSIGQGIEKVHDIGITAVFTTSTDAVAEKDLPRIAPRQLTATAEQVGRLMATHRL
jgi:glycerate kinase